MLSQEKLSHIIAVAFLLIAVQIIAFVEYFDIADQKENSLSNLQGCTKEAMQCPDGSYVGRTGPNCEFVECQPDPRTYCVVDSDCVLPMCAGPMSKEWADQLEGPDLPCADYYGYSVQCIANICTAVKLRE